MKTLTITTLAIALALAAPLALADAPLLQSISGTVAIVGTKVKTEGAKSEKYVVVYLEKVGDANYPPPSSEPVVLDQRSLVFVPHVLAVQKGTVVSFLNSDTTDHNVFCVDECCKLIEDINAKKAKFLDLGNFPGGEKASHTFNVPGEAVMLCKLHPEMAAYIIVLETPYFTVAEIDEVTQSASFTIRNVPTGDYTVNVWNKRCESPAQQLTVATDGQEDVRIELQRKQRKRNRR